MIVMCRYENIVQIRCLYEGITVQDMLDTWHKMLPKKMKEWGLDRQQVRPLCLFCVLLVMAAAGCLISLSPGKFEVCWGSKGRLGGAQQAPMCLQVNMASSTYGTACHMYCRGSSSSSVAAGESVCNVRNYWVVTNLQDWLASDRLTCALKSLHNNYVSPVEVGISPAVVGSQVHVPKGTAAVHFVCLLLQLVNLFGNVRDDWIASDLKGWLAPNRIYPGVADAVKATLKSDDTEVYIVTTKQVR